MSKKGPIILIDDDTDEGEILADVFVRQSISNTLKCFLSGQEALNYLRTTDDKPFLILCDINMPQMNGIEVRRQITEEEYLRKKSIPFIFYTTSATQQAITAAYEMSVQGFFEKGKTIDLTKSMLRLIVDYWRTCRHPNTNK